MKKSKKSVKAVEKAEQAYKILKERIFSGFYLPRERLVESSLSKDLGVNRMIARDTLKRLSIEGLVDNQPYKGCSVADLSIKQVYETYQVEAVLEGFAACLAAERITDDKLKELSRLINDSKKVGPDKLDEWEQYNRKIHGLINNASKSPSLLKTIRNNLNFTRYWLMVLSIPGEIPKRNKDHALILDALRKRDAEAVRRLVEAHIMDAAEDSRRRMQDMFPAFRSKK